MHIKRFFVLCMSFFLSQRPLAGCIVVRLGVDPRLRHLTCIYKLWSVQHDPSGCPHQPELHRLDQTPQVRLQWLLSVTLVQSPVAHLLYWQHAFNSMNTSSVYFFPFTAFSPPSVHVSLRDERLLTKVQFPCAASRRCSLEGCCPVSRLIKPWTTVTVYNAHNQSDIQVSKLFLFCLSEKSLLGHVVNL